MDCSSPGSSVYGIFQARILEKVAISTSRVTSRPRDQPEFLLCKGEVKQKEKNGRQGVNVLDRKAREGLLVQVILE